MAKRYHVRFQVSGATGFPIDMLRYDRCTPDTEQDSWAIERSATNALRNFVLSNLRTGREDDGVATITIRSDGRHKGWMPTGGRWFSFGWHVNVRSVTYTPEGAL